MNSIKRYEKEPEIIYMEKYKFNKKLCGKSLTRDQTKERSTLEDKVEEQKQPRAGIK